jgi:hypothetical protein
MRRALIVAQFSVGVANAYMFVSQLADSEYMKAGISALCIVVTACWIIPPRTE